jgi:hypothetical protein
MRTGRRTAIAAAVLTLASAAAAEVKTKEIEYKQGDTVLLGLVVWNEVFR